MAKEMTPLTPERLAEIEKRCNAATAGPWERNEAYPTQLHSSTKHAGSLVVIINGMNFPRDVDFVLHSRTDIPDLLSEIKRLNGELNGNLRKFIDYPNDPFYKFHPDYGWQKIPVSPLLKM
jgi:hypothetical protein